DVAVSRNDTTLYNQGLALFKLDNYTGAIEYYDKALTINPKDVNALTDNNIGNHTGAVEYYDKALAMGKDPHDIRALASKDLSLGGIGNNSVSLLPCFICISSNLATFSIIKFPLLSYNFIKLARMTSGLLNRRNVCYNFVSRQILVLLQTVPLQHHHQY